ncbi:MAG: SAM-dependent methyltransferase [Anaerolineae bacterium]|nr:SAM-dependent methyltransferase [Anaerolineae bacterium]
MNEDTFAFLLGPAGSDALARLAAEDLSNAHTLALLNVLRRELPPEQAGAALTLARLREHAAAKFSRAGTMFFTPEALEQASGEVIAAWRARRFAEAGFARVADLGCGIGGDTLALAALPGVWVAGLDRDPLRLRLARANVRAYGYDAGWLAANLTDPLPLHGIPAAFFDPARRDKGRRVFSVRDYQPLLDAIRAWTFDALAVKLSPGVALDELAPYTGAGAGVEFISVAGELKEAVLWMGAFGFAGRCATRLNADGSAATLAPAGLPAPPLSEPRAYLYEPDPAVIRAGLFGELAAEIGAGVYRLDETIAYLTGDTALDSGWLRTWPVEAWLPFHLKRLRAALVERGVGRVTVKKRGSPIAPETLQAQLRLDGAGRPAVVVLTRVAGQHCALICGEPLGRER